MSETERQVNGHYSVGGVLDSIYTALETQGVNIEKMTLTDLSAVDEFHIRGRESTIELAERAGLGAGDRVLDVGCGLGGSVRYLTMTYGCDTVGVDLTEEYVSAARELSNRVGMINRVAYQQGSALALPFNDGSFDVVWTEHVQMNIADKPTFYGEIARVLKPGGRLMFHDIFQGPTGEVAYPVPWADDPSISFLWLPSRVRALLEELGFELIDWEDKTRASADWFAGVIKRVKADGPPPVGIHLLMGATAKEKMANMVRNLTEENVAVVQAVGVKK